MCSSTKAHGDAAAKSDGLKFRVDDMTCGHCAASITKAIKKGIPSAEVHADPVSKLVSVTGAGNMAAVQDLVRKAGFTPAAA